MKILILAAGQGTRLRPLTDDRPKCLVEINGISIVDRQIDTMLSCGIKEDDIMIVCGYCNKVLQESLGKRNVHFVVNEEYETTNMVYSLMCARDLIEIEDDIIISYGDIVYNKNVLNTILSSKDDISVVVDDEWYQYWSLRCENPLDDVESLMIDSDGLLSEIGQKTDCIAKVQSQYIGLMRFKGDGLKSMLNVAEEAKKRSDEDEQLWRTDRNYKKMYMTDLLQGMIDEGYKLRPVHINRGWFEIDNMDDLAVAKVQIWE